MRTRKESKSCIVPAWVFQAISLMLCLTSLIGLMSRFGMFPPKTASFISEYGGSVTINANNIGFLYDVLLFVFWTFIAVKCFARHCVTGGIGGVSRVLACLISTYCDVLYSGLINTSMTYEEVLPTIELCGFLSYVNHGFVILGIFLLVIKADISISLRAGFIGYPIIWLLVLIGLNGNVWYPWCQMVYAAGLLVWSMVEDNKRRSKQLV